MARDYAKFVPSFWTGTTGRAIRAAGQEAQLVATYLLTCPSANMIGLYYLPLPTLSHETGSSLQGASKALRRLGEIGFAHYDEATEVVWVPEMARHQVAASMKASDKQCKGVLRELEPFKNSRFYGDFCEKYWVAFSLPGEPPAKPLARPFEGPSEALRSKEKEQEKEKEKEKEKEQEQEPAPPAPDRVLPVFAYWRLKTGGIGPERPGKVQRGHINARLAEGWSEADLIRVVDGALVDAVRWPERLSNMDTEKLYGTSDKVKKFVGLATAGAPPAALKDIRRGNQRSEDQGWPSFPAEERGIG